MFCVCGGVTSCCIRFACLCGHFASVCIHFDRLYSCFEILCGVFLPFLVDFLALAKGSESQCLIGPFSSTSLGTVVAQQECDIKLIGQGGASAAFVHRQVH